MGALGGDSQGDPAQFSCVLSHGGRRQFRVRGDVRASERGELTSSGAIEGSVQAPKVVIAEGARLEGSVAMAPEEKPGPPEAGKSREG